MSYSQLSALGGVAFLTGVGVFAGARWRRVEVRRAELNKEYTHLVEETRALEEDRLRMKKDLKERQVKNDKMHETVETIWADRIARYGETNLDMHSYITALPEALGALKALNKHYKYMSEEMRKFIGFDVACSKVHSLSLLLESADIHGLPSVLDPLKKMFITEPIIQVVCDSVKDITEVKYPNTIPEASVTFVFCMEELDRAMETVTRENEVRLTEPERRKNMTSEWAKVLNFLKLDSLSKGQRELLTKRSALDALMKRDLRQLHTEEDILSAILYCDRLVEEPSSLLKESAVNKNELFDIYFRHPDMRKALSQLELWKNSAVAFMKERQARDVLHCYSSLLTETLVHVNSVE